MKLSQPQLGVVSKYQGVLIYTPSGRTISTPEAPLKEVETSVQDSMSGGLWLAKGAINASERLRRRRDESAKKPGDCNKDD